MRFQTAEKERILESMDMSFLKTLDSRAQQRVLQTSEDLGVLNKDSPDLSISFAGFVQILSDKTGKSLQGSSLAPHPGHMVLLDFSKEDKKRPVRRVHSLLVFLSVETERGEGMREVVIDGPRKLLYGYFTSQILDAEKLIG